MMDGRYEREWIYIYIYIYNAYIQYQIDRLMIKTSSNNLAFFYYNVDTIPAIILLQATYKKSIKG